MRAAECRYAYITSLTTYCCCQSFFAASCGEEDGEEEFKRGREPGRDSRL